MGGVIFHGVSVWGMFGVVRSGFPYPHARIRRRHCSFSTSLCSTWWSPSSTQQDELLEAVHSLSPGRCSGTDFLQKSGQTIRCRVSSLSL